MGVENVVKKVTDRKEWKKIDFEREKAAASTGAYSLMMMCTRQQKEYIFQQTTVPNLKSAVPAVHRSDPASMRICIISPIQLEHSSLPILVRKKVDNTARAQTNITVSLRIIEPNPWWCVYFRRKEKKTEKKTRDKVWNSTPNLEEGNDNKIQNKCFRREKKICKKNVMVKSGSEKIRFRKMK